MDPNDGPCLEDERNSGEDDTANEVRGSEELGDKSKDSEGQMAGEENDGKEGSDNKDLSFEIKDSDR
jgi:hypothetical protein